MSTNRSPNSQICLLLTSIQAFSQAHLVHPVAGTTAGAVAWQIQCSWWHANHTGLHRNMPKATWLKSSPELNNPGPLSSSAPLTNCRVLLGFIKLNIITYATLGRAPLGPWLQAFSDGNGITGACLLQSSRDPTCCKPIKGMSTDLQEIAKYHLCSYKFTWFLLISPVS